MDLNKKEYEESLDTTDVQWEEVPSELLSPINEPVKQGEISGNVIDLSASAPRHESNEEFEDLQIEEELEIDNLEGDANSNEPKKEPLDAPEQEIDAEESEEYFSEGDRNSLNIPDSHSRVAANSIIGVTSHMLEVGAGFFVKIKKEKSFYQFEEVIQQLDAQNDKNVKRFRLDEEDQALLRPILIQVLNAKAQKLTPEQQLMGAALAILMKKGQMALEIKAENQMLVEQLKESIRTASRFNATENQASQKSNQDQQKEAA
jgi:hypothetical protein